MCEVLEISRVEGEIQQRRYVVLQVKCLSLLPDRNQTYTNCSACAVRDRFEVSDRFLEQKTIYGGGPLFP